jgi:hypothetical protein
LAENSKETEIVALAVVKAEVAVVSAEMTDHVAKVDSKKRMVSKEKEDLKEKEHLDVIVEAQAQAQAVAQVEVVQELLVNLSEIKTQINKNFL